LRAIALSCGFDLLEDAVERGAIEQSAVDDYGGDLLCVVNVVQRVGAKQNQVRDLPRFH